MDENSDLMFSIFSYTVQTSMFEECAKKMAKMFCFKDKLLVKEVTIQS